jgi:hypothetical protein
MQDRLHGNSPDIKKDSSQKGTRKGTRKGSRKGTNERIFWGGSRKKERKKECRS